jgi:hypothetical protein
MTRVLLPALLASLLAAWPPAHANIAPEMVLLVDIRPAGPGVTGCASPGAAEDCGDVLSYSRETGPMIIDILLYPVLYGHYSGTDVWIHGITGTITLPESWDLQGSWVCDEAGQLTVVSTTELELALQWEQTPEPTGELVHLARLLVDADGLGQLGVQGAGEWSVPELYGQILFGTPLSTFARAGLQCGDCAGPGCHAWLNCVPTISPATLEVAVDAGLTTSVEFDVDARNGGYPAACPLEITPSVPWVSAQVEEMTLIRKKVTLQIDAGSLLAGTYPVWVECCSGCTECLALWVSVLDGARQPTMLTTWGKIKSGFRKP